MTPFARWSRLVVAAIVAAGLTGCGEDEPDDQLPRNVTSSTTTEVLSHEEAAEKRAKELAYQFVSGRTTILSSPEDFTSVASIGYAEGRAATSLIAEAGDLVRKDRRRTGEAELATKPKVTKIDLDPGTTKGEEVHPYVEVRACIDASDTRFVDAKGKKVAEGEGPHPVKLHVQNRNWPEPAAWRISWYKEIKGDC